MPKQNIKQIKGATQGSVLFLGPNGIISENNDQLNWDNTIGLGIGTASPSTKLNVFSTSPGAFRLQDTTQVAGYILTSDSNGVGTWQPSSIGVTVSNGLTYSGGIIKLGGVLTEHTLITNGNRSFTMSTTNVIEFYKNLGGTTFSHILNNNGSLVRAVTSTGYNLLAAGDGDAKIEVKDDVSGVSFSNIKIFNYDQTTGDGSDVSTNNRMVVRDDYYSKGLIYYQDYSANFTNNSLVTKAYVLSVIPGSVGVTAYNGLTYSGGYIGLGGTLSQNTVVNGSGYDLTLGNIDYLMITSSVFDVVSELVIIDAGTGSADIYGDAGVTLVSAGGNIDLLSTGGNVNISGTAGNVTITGLLGLVYTADYSATFITQSLVTKGYVDSVSGGGGGFTANNGLTYSGGYIGLGGYLDRDTIISSTSSSLTFSFYDPGDASSTPGGLYFLPSTKITSLYWVDFSGTTVSSLASVDYSAIETMIISGSISSIRSMGAPSTSLDGSGNNSLIVHDEISKKGLVYYDDYTGQFTTHSLVTKGYVDSVSGGGSGFTVSNGLTYSGGDIKLGGFLSEPTLIENGTNPFTMSSTGSTIYISKYNDTGIGTPTHSVSLSGSGVIIKSIDIVGNYSKLENNVNSISISSSDGVSSTTFLSNPSYINMDSGLDNMTFWTASQLGGDGSLNNTMIVSDTSNFKGLVYAASYSSNFTTYSLVTKEYVDSVSAGFTGSGTDWYVARWITTTQLGTGSIYDSGTAVGIATQSDSAYALNVYGDVNIAGTLYATSKSFEITHPLDSTKRLTYGSLEGPEYGVYYRGKLDNNNIIDLPDYWTALVDETTISVNITPYGMYQRLFVDKIENNKVYIGSDNSGSPKCYYVVYAERKDIPKIIVEK